MTTASFDPTGVDLIMSATQIHCKRHWLIASKYGQDVKSPALPLCASSIDLSLPSVTMCVCVDGTQLSQEVASFIYIGCLHGRARIRASMPITRQLIAVAPSCLGAGRLLSPRRLTRHCNPLHPRVHRAL
eukprot:1805262-Amphidinium_carterae.1